MPDFATSAFDVSQNGTIDKEKSKAADLYNQTLFDLVHLV
jgi:hypothetical protein